MRILAAIITDLAQTYLHPGYGSTMPRAFNPLDAPSDVPALSLDMVDALRLESTPADTTILALVLSVVSIFATVAIVSQLKKPLRFRIHPALMAVLGLALGVGPPAHAAVSTLRYADPELATQAIMHGIIADAIVDAGSKQTKIGSLSDLDVGIPSSDPTPGMRHALENHTMDGWGRPFRFKGGWAVGYLVWSAGADGSFKTKDDIKARFELTGNYDWDYDREALYVTRSGDELVVLFHAWTGDTFEYHDLEKATDLTGSDLYDVVDLEKFGKHTRTYLKQAYEKASGNASHEPLVLVAWPRT